jgi:hypothetical protein
MLSGSDSQVNLLKNFALNAAPQFAIGTNDSVSSSKEQIFFKTQRSKSYSCQSSSSQAGVPVSLFPQSNNGSNFLSPTENALNFYNTSFSSFHSLGSDTSNRNRLNLPGWFF